MADGRFESGGLDAIDRVLQKVDQVGVGDFGGPVAPGSRRERAALTVRRGLAGYARCDADLLLPAVAGVGANVRVSRAPGPLGETDIAVDPTDANHMLGGSRDLNGGPVRVCHPPDTQIMLATRSVRR